ncbi:MAG: hypothetical protein BWY06_03260 [Candidatus Latescibacteria bacterium ADurb.Bin168]|nr:MAG: hypothetical protein BWY06_03260 [Candidatus Latescibacteria bacterium ADurb.Bin168]
MRPSYHAFQIASSGASQTASAGWSLRESMSVASALPSSPGASTIGTETQPNMPCDHASSSWPRVPQRRRLTPASRHSVHSASFAGKLYMPMGNTFVPSLR